MLGMAMTLRLTDEENRRLDELAAVEGRSKQDIIRLAVAERWQRRTREQRVAEAADQIEPRYRTLFGRLDAAETD